jgi:hypothetical protein
MGGRWKVEGGWMGINGIRKAATATLVFPCWNSKYLGMGTVQVRPLGVLLPFLLMDY